MYLLLLNFAQKVNKNVHSILAHDKQISREDGGRIANYACGWKQVWHCSNANVISGYERMYSVETSINYQSIDR